MRINLRGTLRPVCACLPLLATAAGAQTSGPATHVVAADVVETDGRYHLYWRTERPGTAVDVYASDQPGRSSLEQGAKLVSADSDGALEVAAAKLGARPFFLVKAGAQDPGVVAATRVVPLEGQTNFRDLGGYQTADGRHVKWGQVYRSGELSRLTAADYKLVAMLRIRTVCDLRDQKERASRPTAWEAGPVQTFVSAKTETSPVVESFMSSESPDASHAREAISRFYGQMPRLYAPEYRTIFQELLEGRTPLLLHCTAGKDRSGVASALILAALGVPRSTIVQDYELTETLLKPQLLPATTPLMQRINSLPPDVRSVLMRADPAYIDAAFSSIQAEYGSLDGYLSTELGVGPRQRAELRARLLD